MGKLQRQAKEKLENALKNIKWLTPDSKTKFNYLAGINRPITPGQVTTISKSVELYGVLRPIIILETDCISGKREKYIGDGQHLFNACLRLGVDIPYIVINVDTKEELVEVMAMLNASSKTWVILDYVRAFSSFNQNFVKLNHYFQVYDIEMSIVAAILSNLTVAGSSVAVKKIKSGELVIENEEQNVSILDDLTDILKFVPRMNRFENRYVCSEYVNFRRTEGCAYDHDEFLKNLEKNKQKFILATQEQERLSDMFRKLAK
jgi:hypothetical protein